MSNFAIDEEFLQQIEQLQMLIKNNVAGMFGGNHRSRSYGSSCDFSDYREYVAGDDTAKIDWNSYARTENLYVKLYADERQMHTRIYIDASKSMEYGKGNKHVQALKIAAAIAYLSVNEMDKVSVYAVRDKKCEEVLLNVLGKDSFTRSINALKDIRFEGDSYITDSILQSAVGYGDGLSVIISDFLTDNDYEGAIDHLVAKKRDVLCVQVLSKEELHPHVSGKMHFYDSESNSRSYRKNINREIVNAYKQALEYVKERISGYCKARGAEYMLVPSEDSVYKIFFDKLVNMGVLK